jgi:hypothetical protein
MREFLEDLPVGERVSSSQWGYFKDLHRRNTGGAGMWQDSTGCYTRPVPQDDVEPGRFFKLNVAFTKGATVSVRWWQIDPETKKATIDSGEDFDVTDAFDWWPDAEADTKGHAYWDAEAEAWIIDDMDCETDEAE